MKGKKTHIIISNNAVKAFDKLQHPFMMKILDKVAMEGNVLSMIKAICKNPQLASY